MRSLVICLVSLSLVLPAVAEETTTTPPVEPAPSATPSSGVEEVVIGEGLYKFSVDTRQAPDLDPWVKEKLIPVIKEWYPKIVEMLPGKEFKAPTSFSLVFDPKYSGVAATMGTTVVCDPSWYRQELDREGLGSVVHELVHVVQQYGRQRVPGWLTEGVADYIRWYLYEPKSNGCVIPPNAVGRVRHDQSYRISANFLHWVIAHHDKDLVQKLNAALREGRYAPALWTEWTSKDLAALAVEWKKSLADQK